MNNGGQRSPAAPGSKPLGFFIVIYSYQFHLVRLSEKSLALVVKAERLCRVFLGASNNSLRSTVG